MAKKWPPGVMPYRVLELLECDTAAVGMVGKRKEILAFVDGLAVADFVGQSWLRRKRRAHRIDARKPTIMEDELMLARRSYASVLLGIVMAALLAGCSTEQAYDAAQDWQRQGCQMINDTQERSRCLENSRQRYDDYKKQTDAIKGQ